MHKAHGRCACRTCRVVDANVCTGLTATWCPLHGDCRCHKDPAFPPLDDGPGDYENCPLHGSASTHPEQPPAYLLRAMSW